MLYLLKIKKKLKVENSLEFPREFEVGLPGIPGQ